MRFFLKTIVFLIITLQIGFSQDYRVQLNYADSLFNAENYFDAVTEYKRFLFFNKNAKNEFYPNYRIGLSYKAGARLDDAVRYFTLASIKAGSNKKKYPVLVDLARTNILRRTCSQAHKIIDNLMASKIYEDKKDELVYWKGFAYIFENKWKEAAGQFALLKGKQELVQLCNNVEDEKISVTFAKVISYILPGSGQIYAGEYLSGIISLGWNFLLGYHTIKAAVDERIFDTIVVGNLLWFRFYRGNIQNAEQFATEKNIRIANKALKYLQTKYIGIKP